jgi:hypothetical protein
MLTDIVKLPIWLDPRFWLAAIIWTALTFGTGWYFGASGATAAAEVAEAGRTALAVATVTALNDQVLADERELRRVDREGFDQFKEKSDAKKNESDQLVADLRRDVKRLRVPVRPRGEAQATTGGPAAEGTGDEGHAELTEDASVFLVNLLARGDQAIIKHAEVVDRYERLRLMCTKEQPDPVLP